MDLKAEDENLKAFDQEFENLREQSDGLLDDEEDLGGPEVVIDERGCCDSTKNQNTKLKGGFFQEQKNENEMYEDMQAEENEAYEIQKGKSYNQGGAPSELFGMPSMNKTQSSNIGGGAFQSKLRRPTQEVQ